MKSFESYASEIGFSMNNFIERTDNAKKEFAEMMEDKNNSQGIKSMAYHVNQLLCFATIGAVETMKEINADIGDIATLYLTIVTAILNGPIEFEKLVIAMVESNHRGNAHGETKIL
jgi:hypothetical protein